MNLGVFSMPDPLKVAVVRAFAAAAVAGEELAAAGLVAELVVGALPELAAGLPLPWEEMALIAMIATTKPTLPARTFRTRCLFRRGPRGGCGPYP